MPRIARTPEAAIAIVVKLKGAAQAGAGKAVSEQCSEAAPHGSSNVSSARCSSLVSPHFPDHTESESAGPFGDVSLLRG